MADLESYMTQLEKKQQNVEKMLSKLDGHSSDDCKKSFDSIKKSQRNRSVYISVGLYTMME